MSMMSIETIIQEMTDICQKQGVEHLILFGSFATNTALERSDIDFAVKGCKDILKLEDAVEKIETLCKIDVGGCGRFLTLRARPRQKRGRKDNFIDVI